MQLVDGMTLDKLGPTLSLHEKVFIIKTVAEAIHAAHKLGIIHRGPILDSHSSAKSQAYEGRRNLRRNIGRGPAGRWERMTASRARGNRESGGSIWRIGLRATGPTAYSRLCKMRPPCPTA